MGQSIDIAKAVPLSLTLACCFPFFFWAVLTSPSIGQSLLLAEEKRSWIHTLGMAPLASSLPGLDHLFLLESACVLV